MTGPNDELVKLIAGKRVLVTGATGFIGSRLTERLIAAQAEVSMVSRRPQRSNRAGSWHVADLADLASCTQLIGATAPEIVFHLASSVTGARDIDLVAPIMAANQIAAVNLMTAITKETPHTSLILAGSIEERRGEPHATPVSPYSAAKAATTSYARMFHRLWGTRVTVLQLAMIYGPGQSDLTKLIPYATLELLRDRSPRLSSGTRLVDWVYIDDAVDALIQAAGRPSAIGQEIDICSGRPVSIHHTVDLLASVIGTAIRPDYGAVPDRPIDLAQVGNPGAAENYIDWRPSTGLRHGLRKTAEWYAGRPFGLHVV